MLPPRGRSRGSPAAAPMRLTASARSPRRRGELRRCMLSKMREGETRAVALGCTRGPAGARRGALDTVPRPPRRPTSNLGGLSSPFFLPALNSRRCAGGGGGRAAGHARRSVARRVGSPVRRRGAPGQPLHLPCKRWAPAAPHKPQRNTTAGAEVHETPRTRGARPRRSAAATGNVVCCTRKL